MGYVGDAEISSKTNYTWNKVDPYKWSAVGKSNLEESEDGIQCMSADIRPC